MGLFLSIVVGIIAYLVVGIFSMWLYFMNKSDETLGKQVIELQKLFRISERYWVSIFALWPLFIIRDLYQKDYFKNNIVVIALLWSGVTYIALIIIDFIAGNGIAYYRNALLIVSMLGGYLYITFLYWLGSKFINNKTWGVILPGVTFVITLGLFFRFIT